MKFPVIVDLHIYNQNHTRKQKYGYTESFFKPRKTQDLICKLCIYTKYCFQYIVLSYIVYTIYSVSSMRKSQKKSLFGNEKRFLFKSRFYETKITY
ncbi:MAG TPA: hypothetical protein DEF02_01140 [Clostridiales bacterium]|nr:hypothetical protein [Clostridiales bacterium]HBW05185.1 hypothetical protein [Clostridiales bacterium]HCH92782.1 hypothetical protein [Clostridiales bacterium]